MPVPFFAEPLQLSVSILFISHALHYLHPHALQKCLNSRSQLTDGPQTIFPIQGQMRNAVSPVFLFLPYVLPLPSIAKHQTLADNSIHIEVPILLWCPLHSSFTPMLQKTSCENALGCAKVDFRHVLLEYPLNRSVPFLSSTPVVYERFDNTSPLRTFQFSTQGMPLSAASQAQPGNGVPKEKPTPHAHSNTWRGRRSVHPPLPTS